MVFKADKWKDIKKVMGICKEKKAHTPTQFVRHYKVQEQLHSPARYIDDIELIQIFIQEKQDWITFLKDGHSMTEELVQQRIKTPEVLEAFKRAKIKSLPAKVLAAYKAEYAQYDRYSNHTEDIAQKSRKEAMIEILMGLIQKRKLTHDDVMQSDDYSPELKAELVKRLPPTNG